MEVNESLILKLERLARLQLDNDTRTQVSSDLTRILQMVDKLSELDTTGVAPLVYLNETTPPPAADVAEPPYPVEKALQNAPKHDDQYFWVPKVIEE